MKTCKVGIWNETIPDIKFDKKGVSNYAKIQYALMENYPRGKKGLGKWKKIVSEVKNSVKDSSRYNCIVGVSGGVDSSYLLYELVKTYKLKPLAVNLDNGWNSEIAVKNIKKMTSKLDVDLETYVIDYEEIKDLLRSYMKSGLPWIDTPTDSAIKSVMYKIARSVGVKYIFRGNDFRSEGKQPTDWTYSDYKQLKYIHSKFGRIKRLKTYPFLPLHKIIVNSILFGIKDIRPYYYLEYDKQIAKNFLEEKFGWEYYGGHHHENIFTKFVMSYWLPKKFNIDKRIINLSAQVLSGQKTRTQALKEIEAVKITEDEFEKMQKFILSKLDFSKDEFDEIWKSKNKNFKDYPSDFFLIQNLKNFFGFAIKLIFQQKPMTFVAMEVNNKLDE